MKNKQSYTPEEAARFIRIYELLRDRINYMRDFRFILDYDPALGLKTLRDVEGVIIHYEREIPENIRERLINKDYKSVEIDLGNLKKEIVQEKKRLQKKLNK